MNEAELWVIGADVLRAFREKQRFIHIYDKVNREYCTCDQCVRCMKEAIQQVLRNNTQDIITK